MPVNSPVYHPEIQVLVLKNVGRATTNGGDPASNRYKGATRVIDLTPWLSEKSSVRTSKSTREPAGGFSISIADRIEPGALDSLYGLLEPMDMVEIRMAHEPWKSKQKNGNLPIIMRGFISNVSRPESIGGDGTPNRRVVITGQDYGKIWQIYQIAYLPNYTAGEVLITEFKLFAQYGVGFEVKPAREFLRDIIYAVLNPFLNEMRGQGEIGQDPNTSPIKGIHVNDSDLQTGYGIVAPFGASQWNGGAVYDLLSTYLDVGAFCELFLEDREDGVYVVYRQNPFYTLHGDKITEYGGRAGFTDPATADVPASDITGINVSRSDAHLANYFWVRSPRHEIAYGPLLQLVAAQNNDGSFYLNNHANANPKLYGLRKMEEQTNQGAPDEKYNGNGTPQDINYKQEIASGLWITARRKQLIAQNQDNVVFESGTISIRGREDIKAGMYINLLRGSMFARYYVVQVDHEFIPFTGFFTTLTVERGTGFSERIKRGAGAASPYYSEMVDHV